MKSTEAIETLQVGQVKTGWAWWNRLRAKQAIAAKELADSQTSYVQSLINRKLVEADMIAVESRLQHLPRDLELEYQQKELLHARAELEYNQAELKYKTLERQSQYKAAMLYFLEQVAYEAARHGRTLATHQQILRQQALTQAEIDKLWAESDSRVQEIGAKTESELLLLDKKLESALAILDAKTRNQIDLLLVQGEQELKRMVVEAGLLNQRMEIETDLRIKEILDVERVKSQLRINEIGAESEIKIREADGLANIEVRKTALLKWIEIESRRAEIEQDLKAGFVFAQKEYQYLRLLKEYLFTLYEERKFIESGNGAAKDDQLRLITKHIEMMERDFNAQQTRLLQAAPSEDTERSNQDTNFPGDIRTAD